MNPTARRWVPWAVAAATAALVVAVPVGRAVLSSPARPAAEPGEPSPTEAVPSLPTALPTTPEVTASELPTPTATPSPAVIASHTPRPVATASGPQPYSAAWYEAKYCRDATKTTGAITLQIQVCRWAGAANDRYSVTMSYTGSRVFRSIAVDHGDGTTEPNAVLHQWSCADTSRPNPSYFGERVHEWPQGTYTVTVTVVAHTCGNDAVGPEYEDTDHPETASVSLVIHDIA